MKNCMTIIIIWINIVNYELTNYFYIYFYKNNTWDLFDKRNYKNKIILSLIKTQIYKNCNF